MIIYIYALSDPRTHEAYRYIGQTADLHYRYRSHCLLRGVPKSTKELWLAEIIPLGWYPKLTVLEQCDELTANSRETHWQGIQPPFQLTNDRNSPHTRFGRRQPKPNRDGALAKASDKLRLEYLRSALSESNWNISKAAVNLGISRPTLYEQMQRLGVKRPETRV